MLQGGAGCVCVTRLIGATCPAMNCPKPGGKVRVEMSRVTNAGKSSRLRTEGHSIRQATPPIGQEPLFTSGLRSEQGLDLYINSTEPGKKSFWLCLMPQLQG